MCNLTVHVIDVHKLEAPCIQVLVDTLLVIVALVGNVKEKRIRAGVVVRRRLAGIAGADIAKAGLTCYILELHIEGQVLRVGNDRILKFHRVIGRLDRTISSQIQRRRRSIGIPSRVRTGLGRDLVQGEIVHDFTLLKI